MSSMQPRERIVCLVGRGDLWLGAERAQTHQLHESLDPLAVHVVAPATKHLGHHPRAVLRVGQVEPVDLFHQGQVEVGLGRRGLVVVVGGTSESEQLALGGDG